MSQFDLPVWSFASELEESGYGDYIDGSLDIECNALYALSLVRECTVYPLFLLRLEKNGKSIYCGIFGFAKRNAKPEYRKNKEYDYVINWQEEPLMMQDVTETAVSKSGRRLIYIFYADYAMDYMPARRFANIMNEVYQLDAHALLTDVRLMDMIYGDNVVRYENEQYIVTKVNLHGDSKIRKTASLDKAVTWLNLWDKVQKYLQKHYEDDDNVILAPLVRRMRLIGDAFENKKRVRK